MGLTLKFSMEYFVTRFPIFSHTKLLLLLLFGIIFLGLNNNFCVSPQNMRELINSIVLVALMEWLERVMLNYKENNLCRKSDFLSSFKFKIEQNLTE